MNTLTIKDYGDSAPGDGTRASFEAKHGKVWNTAELQKDFAVISFCAPFIVVKELATGKEGTLEFCHDPRFYFNFRS